MLALVGTLACGAFPQSSFDFTMTGSIGRQSDTNAQGNVDNGGNVVLDDLGWHIGITLGSLSVGDHKGVAVSLLDKGSNDLFSGACDVTVSPHDSTNGSEIDGVFDCTSLQSAAGEQVAITGGQFVTYISDASNNPNAGPPGP